MGPDGECQGWDVLWTGRALGHGVVWGWGRVGVPRALSLLVSPSPEAAAARAGGGGGASARAGARAGAERGRGRPRAPQGLEEAAAEEEQRLWAQAGPHRAARAAPLGPRHHPAPGNYRPAL